MADDTAVDELIEAADESFASGDYRAASAGWEAAFATEEVSGDAELRRDVAWNIGLSEAIQNNVERSKWYFQASGYGRERFTELGLDEVYVQIVQGGS